MNITNLLIINFLESVQILQAIGQFLFHLLALRSSQIKKKLSVGVYQYVHTILIQIFLELGHLLMIALG